MKCIFFETSFQKIQYDDLIFLGYPQCRQVKSLRDEIRLRRVDGRIHFSNQLIYEDHNMKQQSLLAEISRRFLNEYKVNRYRLKKISEMSDDELISCCHFYCEENNLTMEWNAFRTRFEEGYRYCSFVEEYIDEGCCYDLQMVLCDMIKPCALPELVIDKEKIEKCCISCKYRW